MHEHGIFFDCIRSEIISLDQIRKKTTSLVETHKRLIANDNENDKSDNYEKNIVDQLKNKNIFGYESTITSSSVPELYSTAKKCVSKFKNMERTVTWTMRMAIEEGDPSAREMLFHRFLR